MNKAERTKLARERYKTPEHKEYMLMIKATKASRIAQYRREPLIQEHTVIVEKPVRSAFQHERHLSTILRATVPADRVIVADIGFVFKIKQRKVDDSHVEISYFTRPRKQQFKQIYCLSCSRPIHRRNLEVSPNQCEQCHIFESD